MTAPRCYFCELRGSYCRNIAGSKQSRVGLGQHLINTGLLGVGGGSSWLAGVRYLAVALTPRGNDLSTQTTASVANQSTDLRHNRMIILVMEDIVTIVARVSRNRDGAACRHMRNVDIHPLFILH
jgi:hypothetical protein